MKLLLSNYKLSISYLISIIILSIIMSVLSLFNISYNLISILSVIINIIFVFAFSYLNSKNVNAQGYKSGLCSWAKIIIVLELLNIISLKFLEIHFETFIYYILLLVISISGGIVGKNNQKKLS